MPLSERIGEPAVSVVVPAYDDPQSLRATLRSLTDQTLPKSAFEVIVVDDGGRRVLEDVVLGARTDLDIRYLRTANGGPGPARDVGAAQARGNYLAFVDHDCRPRPDWLRSYLDDFDPRARAVYVGSTVNGLVDNLFSEAHEAVSDYVKHRFAHGVDRPFFTANNFAISRRDYLAFGGFGNGLRWAHEDRDFADRWCSSGGALRHVEKAVTQHCHDFDFASFCRHHYSYGVAVVDFHARRRNRSESPFRFAGIGFHIGLMTCPLRRHRGWKDVQICGAAALSQAAYLAGFLKARATRLGRFRRQIDSTT
jgi:glycosyltransferase involved in cell wall biosynthesis